MSIIHDNSYAISVTDVAEKEIGGREKKCSFAFLISVKNTIV